MPLDGSETAEMPSMPAVRAELEAVLGSSVFRKSERHSRFLRFVCEATLNGEGSRLKELLIAQEVFDRGAAYSPGEDSVVRRHAYSVRQKLQEYYATEGRQNHVRIGLPVGRYVPTFSFATGSAATVRPDPATETGAEESPPAHLVEHRPEPVVDPQSPLDKPVRRTILWWALASLCSIVFFTLGWGLSRLSAPRPAADPSLAEVWGNWMSQPQETVLCFSNPLLAQIFAVPEPFSPDFPRHRIDLTDPQQNKLRNLLNLPSRSYLYLSPQPGTNAKMGEALGSVRLAAFLTRSGIPVRATQSRLLSWEDFRSKNLVLLGHMESNRWLDPILSKMPLRLGPWQPDKPTRVINVSPRNGEPAEFAADTTGSTSRRTAYALVSMINGVDGRHELLLINGLSTEGTQIGEEFLTDPISAAQLIGSLRSAAPNHRGPWRFQMLLRADVHENVPTRAELVTIRVL